MSVWVLVWVFKHVSAEHVVNGWREAKPRPSRFESSLSSLLSFVSTKSNSNDLKKDTNEMR